MRIAPKAPLLPPVESYLRVINCPSPAASTVDCVTPHGTMPLLPPNDTFAAVAVPLTAFELTPSARMNEKLWLTEITTRTCGAVLPPLIVTVMFDGLMWFLMAYWFAVPIA